MIVRAPNFSRWLCRQHRTFKFKYSDLAKELGVSPQCIDMYCNGRAHPQIMKFDVVIEFIANHRKEPFPMVLLEAWEHIKKDRKERVKK